MSWALLPLLALEGLTVETTTPRALCPTVQRVEAALSERLRVIETGGGRWKLVLENGYRAGDTPQDFLLVQLKDEHGTLRFEQRLRVTGASCDLRAETVALVIADFFQAARGQANAQETQKTPELPAQEAQASDQAQAQEAPKRAQAAPKPPTKVSARVRASNVPTPTKPSDHRAFISLGAGASLADWITPGFSARFALNPSKALQFSFLAVAPARKSEALQGGGSARVSALPARISGTWSTELYGVGLRLGPEVLASYEQAKSRGITVTKTNHRFVFGLGLQLGLRIPLRTRLALYALGAIDYVLPFAASRFEIDGESVLDPGPLRGTAALGVEIDLF